jgi:NADH dehydrogenase FAD-containing subunit
VIIVGGGAVGIEMAGEIAQKYSAKMITIIHSNSVLV